MRPGRRRRHRHADLIQSWRTNGVLYEGLAILGNGAILTGLVLAAIGVFVVERRFMEAALFAAAGACSPSSASCTARPSASP